jgi:hypothetical protein
MAIGVFDHELVRWMPIYISCSLLDERCSAFLRTLSHAGGVTSAFFQCATSLARWSTGIGRLSRGPTSLSGVEIFVPGATAAWGRICMVGLLEDRRSNRFRYDNLSPRTALNRPNGVNTTYGSDSVSRLLNVLHKAGTVTLDGAGTPTTAPATARPRPIISTT